MTAGGGPAARYACPCCGSLSLTREAPGTFEPCDICDWEDDPLQFEDPALRGGANVPSLDEARAGYAALLARRSDALTLAAADGARECLVTFFFDDARGVVRHEIGEDGRHVLARADRAVARAHLDEIIRASDDADGRAAGRAAATFEAVSDAAQLVACGDDHGAHAALPQAPGYVAALGDVRLAATVAARVHAGEEITTTSVSIVLSPAHGCWLLSAGDDELTIEQPSATELRLRLEALLDAL